MPIGIYKRKTAEEIFWSKVIKKKNGCWQWTGSTSNANKGYGHFGFNYKSYNAHRFSYELHFGKIPKGMLVRHTCDNKFCTNPKHLLLGTPQDNTNDMFNRKRATFPHIKLNCFERNEIKDENNISYKILAKQYNVSLSTIYKIKEYGKKYVCARCLAEKKC